MANPIELFAETFPKSIKKSALIMGLIYLIAVIVIVLGLFTAGVVASIIGIPIMAAINNVWINLTILFGAVMVGMLVLIIVDAALKAFMYRGFYQTLQMDGHNFDEISITVRQRLIPTIVATIIIQLLVIIIFAVPAIPLYLLFQEIGLIAAIFVYLLMLVFIAPFFINTIPIVVLENTGALNAIRKGFIFGLKNYLLNLGSLILIGVFSVITAVPVIGMYFYIIFSTLFFLKLYEENGRRRMNA